MIVRAVETTVKFTAYGSLPLPSPDLLKQYEDSFPGTVEQLIKLTVQQGRHRQELERLKTQGEERRLNRGQLIAASVALLGIAIAGFVGLYGNPWVAGVIAIVGVGGAYRSGLARARRSLSSPSIEPPERPDWCAEALRSGKPLARCRSLPVLPETAHLLCHCHIGAEAFDFRDGIPQHRRGIEWLICANNECLPCSYDIDPLS